MRRRTAARAGLWLTVFAAGGSLVGVVGFGLLWRGASQLHGAQAVLGLALLLLGLDRASTALRISLRSRRAVAAIQHDAAEKGAGPR